MKNKLEQYIALIIEQIRLPIFKYKIKAELRNHLEDSKQYYMLSSMDKETAELQAIKDMGNPKEIADKFNEVYNVKYICLFILKIFVLSVFLFIIYNILRNVLSEQC